MKPHFLTYLALFTGAVSLGIGIYNYLKGRKFKGIRKEIKGSKRSYYDADGDLINSLKHYKPNLKRPLTAILLLLGLALNAQLPAASPVVKSVIYEPQTVAPSNPTIGEKYLNTDGSYYRWNGSVWIVDVVSGTNGTDDQTITNFGLTGTTLNIGIEDGNTANVDLAPLQDGTGTDDQQLSISGNTLSLENGGSVALPSGGSSGVTVQSQGGSTNFEVREGSESYLGSLGAAAANTVVAEFCNDCPPASTATASTLELNDYKVYDDRAVDAATFDLSNMEQGATVVVEINRVAVFSINGATPTNSNWADGFTANTRQLAIFYSCPSNDVFISFKTIE